MTVCVTFHCDGCSAVAEATRPVRQRVAAVNGNGFGLGRLSIESVAQVAPNGWVPFTATGATFCPKCASGGGAMNERDLSDPKP